MTEPDWTLTHWTGLVIYFVIECNVNSHSAKFNLCEYYTKFIFIHAKLYMFEYFLKYKFAYNNI